MSLRLFGFDVKVRGEFFLVSLLFGAAWGSVNAVLSWCVVMFLSVLLHELGHAFVARSFGHQPWIELYGMGGLTHYELNPSARHGWHSELAISLAGPGAGFLMGALVYALSRFARLPASFDVFVQQMLFTNIGWGVLNLLPLLPFDGGHAFKAVVQKLAPARSFSLPHQVTVTFGTLVMVAAVVRGYWWVGYLGLRSVASSLGALREARHILRLARAWQHWDAAELPALRAEVTGLAKRAPSKRARDSVYELEIFTALRELRGDDARAAFERYQEAETPSKLLQAVVALDLGQSDRARQLLEEVEPALSGRVLAPLVLAWAAAPEPSWHERAEAWVEMPLRWELAHAIGERLFHAGHYDLCAVLYERAFERWRVPTAAYNAACSHARAGRPAEGLRWLERALGAGLSEVEQLDHDPDLETVRALPEFAALRPRA